MRRIFLIGYMGAGKTTAGKELAKRMNLEFVDMDHYIQARYQKTVGQLFAEYGETEFRNIEHKILREVSDFEDVIISTGGGTPCFFDNIDYMNQVGTTVYLKASPKALSDRLNTCKEKRPLIKDKSEEELYAFVVENLSKREAWYSKAQIIFGSEELISREDVDGYVQQLLQALDS